MKKAVDGASREDVDALEAMLDVDGDGTVSYGEFAAFLEGDGFRETADVAKLRSRLRKQLLKRKTSKKSRFSSSKSSPVDVAAALAAKADGASMDRAAFLRALPRAPLSLALKSGDGAALAKRFAGDDDGAVDFVRFAQWLGADAAGPTAWEFFQGERLSAVRDREQVVLTEEPGEGGGDCVRGRWSTLDLRAAGVLRHHKNASKAHTLIELTTNVIMSSPGWIMSAMAT